MEMVKPRALRPGATIGLVGPSSAIQVERGLERAVEAITGQGYRVKLSESCGQRWGYLSGEDGARARSVNALFADDGVDAILCLRGGYGAPRILDGIDYEAVRRHPKVFVGYSDVTALHGALHQRSGLVSFHGPMAMGMIEEKYAQFSHDSLMRAVSCVQPLGELKNPEGDPPVTVTPGVAEGLLVGGNLSLVAGGLGTPYELDVRGKILFLEDVGEKVYRLDSMLTHLRLAGKFDECAGIVLGDFADCPEEEGGFTLEQVVRQVIVPSGKPIMANLRCGHCTPTLTLPLGVPCRLDAGAPALTILEPAVCP